ncbi:hypothetical protein DD780_05100 [Helicobacter pylori]|nr:hypothetical protein DD780_05100 [Helicobacter pylori]
MLSFEGLSLFFLFYFLILFKSCVLLACVCYFLMLIFLVVSVFLMFNVFSLLVVCYFLLIAF